jgi:hypothetical protein
MEDACPMLQEFSAAEYLKAKQAYFRQCLGLVPRRSEEEVLELALKEVQKRQEQSVRQGDVIHEGAFQYSAPLEEQRWQQTRDIIQRVSPGMDEDPIYVEMLARQAASIEIVLCQKDTNSPNPKALALCERILLGTIAEFHPAAETWHRQNWDQFLVVLSYGLLVFLHHAAQAVFFNWRPQDPPPGTTVSYSYDTKNQSPELLYNTLYAFMFKGYQLADFDDRPPAEYESIIGLWVNYAERFVIAHEYGHTLFRQWGKINPSWQVRPSWQEEFLVDSFAFINTIESAGRLDSVAPNVAFTGVLFSLTCMNIIYKTLDLIRDGAVRQDDGTETHPPTHRRISALKETYRQYIGTDVKYNVHVEGKSGQGKTIDLGINGKLFPSDTLNLLWDSIQHIFLEAHEKKSRLHPIWEEKCS